MNLKKSDKIIAVAAVVVLIIAAVGIILYTETDDEGKVPEKEKYNMYDVVVTTEKEVQTNEYTVKDKIGNKNDIVFTGTHGYSLKGFKQVTFKVDYADNVRGLFGFKNLLPDFGADTLTVTVSGDNMAEQTETIPGNGTVIIYSNVRSPFNFDSIKATSELEARKMLSENLSLKPTIEETYTITVSVDKGEGVLQFLKKALERLGQDTFTLETTSECYYYDVELSEETYEDNFKEEAVKTSGYEILNYYVLMSKDGFF